MGDTIDDTHIEREQKDIKKEILENRRGLPDYYRQVIEEVKVLGLNKVSLKRKGDRILDKIEISLKSHKYDKKKKQ